MQSRREGERCKSKLGQLLLRACNSHGPQKGALATGTQLGHCHLCTHLLGLPPFTSATPVSPSFRPSHMASSCDDPHQEYPSPLPG